MKDDKRGQGPAPGAGSPRASCAPATRCGGRSARTRRSCTGCWGPEIAAPPAYQLSLLRGFLDAHDFDGGDRRGFGRRIVARVEAERDMHECAGRVTAPGSWLHREIDWLAEHADAIDRGLRGGD
ncbi:hypothetical protein [Actinomadura geliboluensis]|uniref:hypothetical protein n=1 Tax=Actinomadura geliboluensis TaxID=882440 RepID=UPI003716BDDA